MAILDFLGSGLSLVWLWISTPNFSGKILMYDSIWVRAYWFSVTSFSKWLPGGHIRFFGFWMAWFSANFMCMSLVAVTRSLRIVSYVAFKMAASWFWTMFNCNLLIAHCHPLLWGGGILVDHWSTISSFSWNKFYMTRFKNHFSSLCSSIIFIVHLLQKYPMFWCW